MELITVKASKKYVTIKMPIELLVFATEQKSDNDGSKVTDREEFARDIASQIDGQFFDPETGLTMFQKFLDEVIEEVKVSSNSISLDD